MALQKIAVIAHAHKLQAQVLLKEIESWADQHNYEVVTNLAGEAPPADSENATGDSVLVPDDKLIESFRDAAWAITLGGDGTILYAAHVVAPLHIPVLAVQLGNLGFHTQVEPKELKEALDAMHENRYRVENRMTLKVELLPSSHDNGEALRLPRSNGILALNDVVVAKTAWGRMVHLRIHVDDEPASDLYADGFLVATPTGSSAYNYAARGPVVEPGMEAMVLNAICPHRINFSPLVLASHRTIRVAFHPRKQSEEAQLVVDGRVWCSVPQNLELKIYKAPVYLRLVVFENRFFARLRDKLAWGGLFWKAEQ